MNIGRPWQVRAIEHATDREFTVIIERREDHSTFTTEATNLRLAFAVFNNQHFRVLGWQVDNETTITIGEEQL